MIPLGSMTLPEPLQRGTQLSPSRSSATTWTVALARSSARACSTVGTSSGAVGSVAGGPALLLVVACTTLLACSLSGSSPDAGSPTEPVSGGGVPIAKSTPIPAESSPAATNPPEPATSAPSPIPPQAGSTPLASGQDIPVQA